MLSWYQWCGNVTRVICVEQVMPEMSVIWFHRPRSVRFRITVLVPRTKPVGRRVLVSLRDAVSIAASSRFTRACPFLTETSDGVDDNIVAVSRDNSFDRRRLNQHPCPPIVPLLHPLHVLCCTLGLRGIGRGRNTARVSEQQFLRTRLDTTAVNCRPRA